MSGILGQLLGSLGGGGGQAGGLSSVLGELLGGRPVEGEAGTATTGGLGGLVSMFQQAGLGEQVKSWIGTGANLPISPQQLAAVLPPERLQAWSQQTGLPIDSLVGALSHALPAAVDHATPEGAIPPEGAAAPSIDVAGLVGRLFGKTA
jgi:uncharacterized protein YidB (DUF937 family)